MKSIKLITRAIRTLSVFAMTVGLAFCAVGEDNAGANMATYRVTPDAVVGGNGQAWADDGEGNAPMTFAEAVAVAAGDANAVLLLKAGGYSVDATAAFAKPVEIRGGFAGTDDETLAAYPYSVFDGEDKVGSIMTFAAKTVLRNLEFTRAGEHAVAENGQNQALEVYDCRFVGNGTQYAASWKGGGRAIAWAGAAPWTGGSCVISNCLFAGNAQAVKGDGTCGGGAVSVTGLRFARIYDCTFTTNGVAWSYPTGADSFGWTSSAACINAGETPVTIIGCKFVANRIASNQSYTYGYLPALIRISADWGGSWRDEALPYFQGAVSVSNCLFVGNSAVAQSTGKQGNAYQGLISVYDPLDVLTCRVDNCTFAYNHYDTKSGSAGITVAQGAAKVRNCIFWGNRIANSADAKGCDIKTTGSSGYVDVDYSLFAGTGVSNVFANTGTLVELGPNVITADPKLVTPFSDIEPLVVSAGSLWNFGNDAATLEALLAADVHVTDKTSKAIDAGDPAYSYALEPSPNGGRINLGAYGGTPEACTTAIAQPEFDGDVELTLPYETTQPRVRFKLGGEAGVVYAASVLIECCTNGVDFFTYGTLPGLGNGDTVDHVFMTAFQTGGTLEVRVTVSAYGAESRVKTVSVELDKPCPASFGKGGGDGVLHVRPGATGDGSGRDWFHAMTRFSDLPSSAAFASAREIWVAGTNVVEKTPDEMLIKDKAVRGGFAGVENSPEERTGDGCAVFDGEDREITAFVVQCSGTVEFDRLAFVRGGWRGVTCNFASAGADVTFRDCRVVVNGTKREDNPGTAAGIFERGLYVKGNSESTVTLTNCVFGGNAAVKNVTDWAGGGTLVLKSLKWAEVDDCLFVTNGIAWNVPTGSASFNWGGIPAVVDARGVRLRLANSRFVANRIASTQSAYADSYKTPMVSVGGLSAKAGMPWDISISNCLFVGNEAVARTTTQQQHDSTAPVFMENSDATVTCRVDNCTFAYNSFDTEQGAAGFVLRSGTARIRNCIFWGNLIAQSGDKGCDVKASGSSGTIDVDYSLFSGTRAANIFAAPGTTVLVGDHIVTEDPRFVTPFPEIEPLVETSGALRFFSTNLTTVAALLAADVHVTNKLSKAIDAGDPAYSYALEPDPNGERVNLGAYGGTREACTTAVAQPEFDGDVELTLPYETTQPRLRFAFGGASEDAYSATVLIECCTNGVDYFTYRELPGYAKGEVFDHVFLTAFQTGGTLDVRVTISAYGAESRVKTVSVELDKPMPASFGKGGGDGVLHVRPGATGDGSGRDWFHAMTSVSALSSSGAFASAREIWIAETNVVTATPDSVGFRDVVVRGGFAGTECSADERTDGVLTVFDGEDRNLVGFVASCSGTVEFERLAFARAGSRGVTCTYGAANSSVTFRDCRIEENGHKRAGGWTDNNARGLHVTGNGTSTLTLTNCAFVGNATEQTSGQEGDGALVAETLERAYLYDCRFVANGVLWTNAVGKGASLNGCGEAAFRAMAPVTMVGCRFVGNRVGAMWFGYGYRSAIVYLAAKGNALTNCLFLANESVTVNGRDSGDAHVGVLLLGSSAETEVANCTFAYNPMSVTAGAAGITVEGGTAKVRNSIFYGNRQYPGTAKGADIWLNGSAGTLDVDYTMFASVDTAHLCANAGCTIATNGESRLYAANPRFVSSLADFEKLISRADNNAGWVFAPTAECLAQVEALNVHLRSSSGYWDETSGRRVSTAGRSSPAIDAGDPESDCSSEPTPNGRRINLGFYGNTPWASMAKGGGMLIVK